MTPKLQNYKITKITKLFESHTHQLHGKLMGLISSLAHIQHFDTQNTSINVKVKHYARTQLVTLGNGTREQADVHRVSFGVIFNFHGVTPYFSNLLVAITVIAVTTKPFSQITLNNMRF